MCTANVYGDLQEYIPRSKEINWFPICFYSHTPKAKATIVADTPEMKRLADNTKIQSNVQYHAEFEATKSNFTAVVDDPGKFPK